MAISLTDVQDMMGLLQEHPQIRAQFQMLVVPPELAMLAERVSQLALRIEQLASHLNQLAARVDQLAEAQQRTEQSLAQLAARVDQLAQRVDQLTQRVDQLAQRVDQLAEAQRRTEERLEQLTQRVDQLTQRVDQLAEAQRRTEERLEQLTQRVDQLTQRVDQLAEAQRRTEERLERLTQRVDQLAEAQRRTEERLERLTQRVDQLAEAQRRTEERLERLEATVQTLVEQVRDLVTWQRGEAGRRAGERYERAIVKRAPALFSGGQGGATDQPLVQQHIARLLTTDSIIEILNDEEDPFLADLIWWKGEQYVVVEASLQINGHDITRAARRAATIRRAGVQVMGVVVGEEWADSTAREQAQALEVEWKVGNDLSPGFIEFRRASA